jgi:putative heme-binding domain-containing protein
VWSDDVDFHPTDVLEDADGSVLVLDTGGWYKLCCPSSQLVKADVTGGIYRVRKVGAHKNRSKPTPRPLPRLYDIALRRDRAGLNEAIAGLSDANRHTRRLAAEALGRIGDAKAVPAIFTALADETNDRPLDHSLTYALIEIADPKATAAGLKHESTRVRRAALIAIGQMSGGNLAAKDVLPDLTADDPAVKDTAWWVAGRHSEWGDDLVGYFRRRLAEKLTTDEWSELADRMARVAASPAVQALLAEAVVDPKTALPAHRAMSKSGLKKVPEAWLTALTTAVRRNNPTDALAIHTLRALPLKDPPKGLIDALLATGRDEDEAPNIRLLALAVVGGGPPLDDHLFDALLLPGLADEKHPLVRAAALDAVDRLRFSPAQLAKLAAALPAARPTERPRLLDAFGKSKDEAAGLALVAALDTPAVRAAVRTDQIKPILDKYPPTVREAAAKLYAELDKARGTERDRLEALIKELPAGDVRRGQVVFNGTKAACAACHKIGYVGGTVGPDLTKIGSIRTERDLLDSLLFPSAALVRGYESVKVTTTDGQDFNGVVRSDAPAAVVLAVAADKEVRIARADIDQMKPGTVSVMPAGLDQQLTKQELADLIAFLKACK